MLLADSHREEHFVVLGNSRERCALRAHPMSSSVWGWKGREREGAFVAKDVLLGVDDCDHR